jgi:hypothetical protein
MVDKPGSFFMNAMTRLFIDYLRLGNNGPELTEWLNELTDEDEGELNTTPNYFAWLAEKRLDFIKQVDLVEVAQRLKRFHYLEDADSFGASRRLSMLAVGSAPS